LPENPDALPDKAVRSPESLDEEPERPVLLQEISDG
jgi:hypothetical protein